MAFFVTLVHSPVTFFEPTLGIQSPSENGFMEPKYLAFRFGDYTPQSSSDKVIGSLGFVIILQLLQLVHFRCRSPILEAPEVKVVNAQKKHMPRYHTSSITNDTIIDMMVYLNQNQWYRTQIVLEKTKLDIQTGVYTTSQTCDNQQI